MEAQGVSFGRAIRNGLSPAAGAAALSLLAMGMAPPGDAQPEGIASPDPLAAELERRLAEDIAPIMERFCYGCHGEERTKGDVRFEGVGAMPDVLAMAGDWEMARELLTTHEMPPEDEPAPSDHERLLIAQWIDDALDYYPPDAPVDPGWFTIHRLNKAEYRNTLRDLLGIDPAEHDLAADLPPDDTGYGFDNIADVLSMSPLQLELYLDAAERAVELGLGPAVEISREPRPVRNLQSRDNGRELRLGGYMLYSQGSVAGTIEVPVRGEYEIVATAWGTPGGDEDPRLSLRLNADEVGEFFVSARESEPQDCVVRLSLEPGRYRVAAAFTNDYYEPNVADRNLAVESIALAGPVSAEGLERPRAYGEVFFVTPGEGAGVDGERVVARRVIEAFAVRAFRRPLRDEEMCPLMLLYEGARAGGDSYEEAVRLVLSAALVSPSFLYRSVDNRRGDDPGFVHRLSDFELASRLSYFLWSSMPDEELMSLARRGRLGGADALREQARRMLADPKADAFIENFAGQWLLLRNLERLDIDTERYPEFTSELRSAMVAEPTMFFADVVRSDRPVLDLLDARDTFVNGPLAELYGIEGVEGPDLRRATLAEGSPRGGVLTMGAVLTVTSNPTRTSPVKRGLYVLDQMLGTPPPPPPPDVPPLEQAAHEAGRDAPLREQLKAHLTNPTCAVCHNRMDPIGLAMENFDAIGRWRDTENGRPIDASGTLPGGVAFQGADGLREILLARDGLFIDNLSRKVLTYALGRGIEPFDRPTVRQIVEHVRANEDRFGAMVEAVVLSEAFRTCRGRAREDE